MHRVPVLRLQAAEAAHVCLHAVKVEYAHCVVLAARHHALPAVLHIQGAHQLALGCMQKQTCLDGSKTLKLLADSQGSASLTGLPAGSNIWEACHISQGCMMEERGCFSGSKALSCFALCFPPIGQQEFKVRLACGWCRHET